MTHHGPNAYYDEGIGTPHQRLAAAVLRGALAAKDTRWLRSDAALWPWITLLTPEDRDPYAVQRALCERVRTVRSEP